MRDRAGQIAGGLLAALAIGWSLDLPIRWGWTLYAEQFVAALIGLALFGIYTRAPHVLGQRWLGPLLALAGLAVAAWIAWRYPVLQGDMLGHRLEAVTLGIVVMVLLIDACRRATGWAMPAVFGFFLAYALVGHLLPGLFQIKSIPVPRLVSYLALDTSSLLGQTMIIVGTTVLSFMVFGKVLQACGGGEWFTDLSMALFGRFRGGSGKVEVVASALFGGISGSAMANVMSTGIITIPNMKRAGYRPETAAAVEAVSSTGGQIMPPVLGAAAFLMAEALQVRYVEVALAAIVPAALFFLSVFIQVDHEAAARGIGGLDPSELPRARDVARRGWFFVLPFVALFVMLFQFSMQAEEAVLYSILVLLPFACLVGYNGHRLTARRLGDALVLTGREAFDLVAICAVASIVIGLLNITGLALSLGFALIKIGQGSLLLLLVIVAFICLLLGMGLPTTGVYLLVALLAAPPLVELGVPPMAAHMFVFYLGCLSMITPPIAMAAYAAAHIAGADHMRVGWIACRLGWPAFVVPFFFAWSPELLLIGKPLDIALTVVFSTAGIWLGCAAIAGRLLDALTVPLRFVAGTLAVLLLVPAGAFDGALVVHAIATIGAIIFAVRELARRRRCAAAST